MNSRFFLSLSKRCSFVAFGEWAGSTADSTLIRMQKRELDALRRALHNDAPVAPAGECDRDPTSRTRAPTLSQHLFSGLNTWCLNTYFGVSTPAT